MALRRQQRKSCDLCRRRKVRCDLVSKGSGPCTTCDNGGIECVVRTEWPPPNRGASSRPSVDLLTDSPIQPRVSESESARTLAPACGPHKVRTSDSNTADGSQTTDPTEAPDNLASTGLVRFFDDVASPDWWRVSELEDNFRVAYIGTPASNLVHLVSLRPSKNSALVDISQPSQQLLQTPQSGLSAWQQPPIFPTNGAYPAGANQSRPLQPDADDQPQLHYPYPQIRPLKSWSCHSQFSLYPSDDLATDLSSFPVLEVRQALVMAYFQHLDPLVPILSRSKFLDSSGNLLPRPPLLLFHAVLLAGAHVCTHHLVKKDRRSVKSVLFRRASMLFHLRHETDRLHLAQAALLFTWHINDGDTISGGPWYWTGEAIRIASGLGLHRHNDRLPRFDHAMYKRLFWAAFVAEVFASLELGRPCAIRGEDIDQSSLCEEDFNEASWTRETDGRVEDASPGQAALAYHLRMVELAYIVLDILTLNSPSASAKPEVSQIDVRLGRWLMSCDLSSGGEHDECFRHLLRIHYYQVVLHLHRNYSQVLEHSPRVCNAAADAIISSVEQIAAVDELKKCPFTVVGAVVAVGIQLVQELRSAVLAKAFLVAIELSERLKGMLKCTKSLAVFWPNAEAAYGAFHGISQDYEHRLSRGLHSVEQPNLPDFEPDWNSLFVSIPPSLQVEENVDQDWLCFTD
ncbi:putative acetamidase regulatory protein [Metarhizium anisopliae]